MKAISLWQPWASLVAGGHKRYETRGWATRYRGPLLIHAAKKWDKDSARLARDFAGILRDAGRSSLPNPLPLGCALAVAELVECVPVIASSEFPPLEREFGDLAPGRYAWRLENVRRVSEPIPVAGAQGLWHPRGELLREVERRLPARRDAA